MSTRDPRDVWREFIAATDFDALANEMSGELPVIDWPTTEPTEPE